MIGVLSKHLPKTVCHIGSPPGDCILEFIFLIESARYHIHNFQKLINGDGEAPAGFQSGTDMRGKMLNHIWCQMASIIEFEGFLTNSKRALDRAWWCLGGRFGEKFKRVDTLNRAAKDLSKSIKNKDVCELIESLRYYTLLQKAWEEWGEELTNLRDFIEHHAPLGGRTSHPTTVSFSNGVESTDFHIPDKIPKIGVKIKKGMLKYENKRSAVEYTNFILLKLDTLASSLLDEVDIIRDINPAERLVQQLKRERFYSQDDLSDEQFKIFIDKIIDDYSL